MVLNYKIYSYMCTFIDVGPNEEYWTFVILQFESLVSDGEILGSKEVVIATLLASTILVSEIYNIPR